VIVWFLSDVSLFVVVRQCEHQRFVLGSMCHSMSQIASHCTLIHVYTLQLMQMSLRLPYTVACFSRSVVSGSICKLSDQDQHISSFATFRFVLHSTFFNSKEFYQNNLLHTNQNQFNYFDHFQDGRELAAVGTSEFELVEHVVLVELVGCY
jgi:hypothetical protein